MKKYKEKILNYFYLKALSLNRSFISTKETKKTLGDDSKDRLIKSITFHTIYTIRADYKDKL